MTVTSRRRSPRAALAGAACVLAVGAALTGCGGEDPDAGTNGVGRLSAAQIQTKTRTAAESARTVRLHGTVVTSGSTYALDMRLKPDGGTGSVTAKGATFGLLRVGEELFLKADAAFWSHDTGEADAAAAEKLAGKYVKVPQGDPSYQKFSGFTDKDVLLDGLLSLHGTVEADGRHERNGVRTVRISGDGGAGGSLDVSLEGTPYPLRLVRAGSAGTLTFSDWNKEFVLEQPAKDDTLDYGRQLPAT